MVTTVIPYMYVLLYENYCYLEMEYIEISGASRNLERGFPVTVQRPLPLIINVHDLDYRSVHVLD